MQDKVLLKRITNGRQVIGEFDTLIEALRVLRIEYRNANCYPIEIKVGDNFILSGEKLMETLETFNPFSMDFK